MSALPKQIQDQIDEAERIQKEMAQQADTPPAPPEPQPAPDPEPVVTAPAEPVEPAKDAAYWEHRFRTLDGIHKAEKARTEEALRLQGDQLRQLTAQFERLQQQPPTPPQPEQPLVSNQDEDKFGADLIDMARRVSREEFRPLLKKLEVLENLVRSVAPKVERVAKVEVELAQGKEEKFWTEITTAVPDWEAINADQKWLAWLREYDPVAGKPRQASLEEAQQALDHRRVVALFKLFKGSAAPAPRTQQSDLARQVAPARNSTVTAQPTQAKVYRGNDYLYWLDPRRVHDTDTAQLTAMKAEMERAFVEGRVQF